MIRPDEGGMTASVEAIKVDLGGLVDFAKVVRDENERTLVPQSYTVHTDFRAGVCFGAASASGYVYAAKERYQQSLIRAMEQMVAYIRAAELIADTAERVAKEYGSTDALSAARMQDVQRAFRAAMTAAANAPSHPPQREP